MEVDGPMNEQRKKRKGERRTGVIFLVLIAATNVVVWMEPVERARVSGEPAASSEIRMALASCFLAAGLIVVSWFFGRHASSTGRVLLAKPRLWGLRLSLLSAIFNLALVGAMLFLTLPRAFPVSELSLLSLAWYLVSLPLQFLSGYAMGAGSRLPGRRAQPATPQAAAR
jgi:hypothetical protein